MPENEEGKKSPGESFADMFKVDALSIFAIFNDPKLKEKAKEFGESASASAKVFASRFKDEDVKRKFKDVGKAAKNFGEGVADYFKDDREKAQNKSEATAASNGATTAEEEPKKKLIETTSSSQTSEKAEAVPKDSKAGRITGYSIAIAWNIALIIFFNFYYRYIAYYQYDELTKSWNIFPFVTSSFIAWLPILTISLIVSIIGNIILIINDSFYVSNITNIVMNIFGIASVSTLLSLFPFDFNVSPDINLTGILVPVITTILILIIIGLGIGILVRFIKIIVKTAKSS
ncbi:MAG: hypothetical protein M1308_09790 [Actinobacteria bacterium]|nr:hypothetical protein [Actinomycetota bacterium]